MTLPRNVAILLNEIHEHIKDPKGQSPMEKNWCDRIDEILAEEQAGLFHAASHIHIPAGVNRVVIDFPNEEHTELGRKQIILMMNLVLDLEEMGEIEYAVASDFRNDVSEIINKAKNLRNGVMP